VAAYRLTISSLVFFPARSSLVSMTHSRRTFIRIVPALGAFAIPVSAFEPQGQGSGPAEPTWPAPPPDKG